jgi:hypothetical protein
LSGERGREERGREEEKDSHGTGGDKRGEQGKCEVMQVKKRRQRGEIKQRCGAA